MNLHATNPLDADSDGDLLPDGWEAANGLDPNSDTGDDGASGDPDSDTYSNLDEYNAGTNPQSDASFPDQPVPVAGVAAFVLTAAALMMLSFLRKRKPAETDCQLR